MQRIYHRKLRHRRARDRGLASSANSKAARNTRRRSSSPSARAWIPDCWASRWPVPEAATGRFNLETGNDASRAGSSMLGLALAALLGHGVLRRADDLRICISARRSITRIRATISRRSSGSMRNLPSTRARRAAARFAALPHQAGGVFGRRLRAQLPDAPSRRARHHRPCSKATSTRACATKPPYRLARIHFQKGQLRDALYGARAHPRQGARRDTGRRRVPARERLHGPGRPADAAPS